MKIRSVTAVLALAVIGSGAMAGETVHAVAHRADAVPAHPGHRALGVSTEALTDVDVARLARSAASMPACSTCH